jgi:hypothetical protein
MSVKLAALAGGGAKCRAALILAPEFRHRDVAMPQKRFLKPDWLTLNLQA